MRVRVALILMPGSSAGAAAASAPHHPARVAHSLGSWFLNLAVDGGHASDPVTDPADPRQNLAIDRQANEERNEAEERSEDVFKWTLLVGIVAVASTIAIGEQLERRHMHRVPEAAIGVLLGVGCAAIAAFMHDDEMMRDETFDSEFFMVYLLPPIIFAAGFNLNIPAFFASIVPTLLLAFVGTCLSALVVAGIVYGAGQIGLCYPMSWLASFFFGALISATDPVRLLLLDSLQLH